MFGRQLNLTEGPTIAYRDRAQLEKTGPPGTSCGGIADRGPATAFLTLANTHAAREQTTL